MQKYKEAILYIVFILIGFIYSIVTLKPQIEELINVENQIKTKTVEVTDLERKLESLKASEVEKAAISGQSKKIYKSDTPGLDEESVFTVMFDDIVDMAKYNGVRIYSIQYTYNPAEDEFVKGAASQYNVCAVDMAIISDYTDLEGFLKEVYKYPYLINIDKIELAPYQKNKKMLLINLSLKLYASK